MQSWGAQDYNNWRYSFGDSATPRAHTISYWCTTYRYDIYVISTLLVLFLWRALTNTVEDPKTGTLSPENAMQEGQEYLSGGLGDAERTVEHLIWGIRRRGCRIYELHDQSQWQRQWICCQQQLPKCLKTSKSYLTEAKGQHRLIIPQKKLGRTPRKVYEPVHTPSPL